MGESIAWASAKSSVFGSTLLVRPVYPMRRREQRRSVGQRCYEAWNRTASAAGWRRYHKCNASALDSTPDKLGCRPVAFA